MAEEKPLEGEVMPEGEHKKPKSEETLPETAKTQEPEPEFLEEGEGFKAQLNEFFEELNISKRHVFGAIGCIVVIALLTWGGLKGYDYYKNRKPSVPQKSIPKEEEKKEEAKYEDTGLLSTMLIGRIPDVSKMPIGGTGIASTISIGQEFEGSTTLAAYILLLRRLQNAYATDIQDSMKQAQDRAARFESHLALLKRLVADSLSALEKINGEQEVIRRQFEPQSKKQESQDINFFEQVNALNPETSQKILNEFITASREVVSLRAKFKALQKVQYLYEIALPRAERRIRDLELNREALISGIKVYDVKGSDLKLVLPAEGEDIVAEERLGAPGPAYPLIPVKPSELKGFGGKDFIGAPGGGLKVEELRAGEKDFITKPQQ